MGWETSSPTPRLSAPHPAHRVYPYWLRGVPITRVHQGWRTELTSLRLHGGFVSLVAVRDGLRRSVLSWALSITMAVGGGLEALEQALGGATPDIFPRDQGAPLTSTDCTGRLAAAGIKSGMDGRGRALDKVFVARLWRTVHYAEVSLKDEETPRQAMQG